MKVFLGCAALFRAKVFLTHSFERGPDKVAVRLDQPGWNSRKRNLDSFRAVLKHSCVLRRIIACNGVGNTVTIKNGLTIEFKKGIAELCIELANQLEPPEYLTAAKPHDFGLAIADSFK